ncbi:MAG: hypothetical protein ABIC19_04660 [Patescibacteria group bacterium]
MQGKAEEVPKEVATWLLERNSRYPNIDFTVDCWDPHPSQIEEFETTARKYSRLYSLNASLHGVLLVIFPYLRQSWNVKIVGGLDDKENIADRAKVENIKPLSVQLRAEIAGLPKLEELEQISDEMIGLARKKGDEPLEKAIEMTPLPSDLRWTSEVSMSGEEFNELLSDPMTKKEAERAIWEKDWETLKRLKEQRRN